MEEKLKDLAQKLFGKEILDLDDKELYLLLSEFSNNLLNKIEKPKKSDRKLYYFSAEFLLGKLLKNNLSNLGIRDEVKEILSKNGKVIEKAEEFEAEPSLGNGGLGRLAACFMDSFANLGLNAEGIGICYHFGLFRQKFEDYKQKEVKDPWLDDSNALIKTDTKYDVNFKNQKVEATMYDLPISARKDSRSTIHFFDIDSVDESIVKEGISFDKKDIEKNLSLFLYPDDSDEDGQKLRINQQYFMVSCGGRYILDEYIKNGGKLEEFGDKIRIQINDTHPTMIIPEMIRLLTSKGLSFEKAVEEITKACAYTNHTILQEALEKWNYQMLEDVVPALMPIIEKLDEIVRGKYDNEKVYIIENKKEDEKNPEKLTRIVHMANIAIHFSSKVNGVAQLHSDILVNETLKDFYEIYPDKFENVTNGISFKRFFHNCNEDLTKLIESLIGPEFKDDPNKLEELLKFQDDPEVLDKFLRVKEISKENFSKYVKEKEGVDLDINSIFDVQIKRLHEYKRQQMNALYVIDTYLKIKKGILPKNPITVIFGAKAAPSYYMAKNIIHLILCLQELINKDEDVNKYLKVVMLTNYNVSYAEKIIPATEISEQISLASKEASGTGNMKMMLNGAVTLGTLDGANVEIRDLVGDENIYIFGKKADQIIDLYEKDSYKAKEIYEKNEDIKKAVDFIVSKEILEIGDKEMLESLHNDLINKDYFMALIDLEEYIEVKNKLIEAYTDKRSFAKMAINNIAKAGFFSSDRSIRDYNRKIWNL